MAEWDVSESQTKRPIQEVRTKWNSCYAMIERFLLLADFLQRVLLKVKREKNTKTRRPSFLSDDELDALTEVRQLLKPLDIVTKSISGEKVGTLSLAIPLLNALKKNLEKVEAVTPIGFQMKHTLTRLIEENFPKIEEQKLYGCATLCDPRFKNVFFSGIEGCAGAINNVGKLIRQHMAASRQQQQQQADIQENSTPNNTTGQNEVEGFWSDLDRAVQLANVQRSDTVASSGMPLELKQFLNRPPVDRKTHTDPLLAWEDLKDLYPNVCAVALRFLPLLATSVPSERLFSHAGLIATQLRNRLSGHH
ncbi:zinc finger BED domain-containing protein 4-like, partial [Frankliniella occidentalis]|uniref:Zinc finger BED domain-containing protein 4-like n=1 Tax=Frankliniella occidentalis TaxID=133901 RepID=A0A9C6WSL6_FRAOC